MDYDRPEVDDVVKTADGYGVVVKTCFKDETITALINGVKKTYDETEYKILDAQEKQKVLISLLKREPI